MYIVIRAGGVGTRLWPVSRTTRPKQMHPLTGGKTLLQEAVDRVIDIEPTEHIYVSCNSQTEPVIRQELEGILEHNYIVEPALRDTAAAVGLETVLIAMKDPQAVIASLGSDHIITDTKEFQRITQLAEQTVADHPDHIVCIGVKPHSPDTGYGYIELGDSLPGAVSGDIASEVFTVQSFKEKPDATTAEEFLHSGIYLWNANMFVWRADTLLRLYEQYQPAMYAQLMKIQAHPEKLPEIYPQIAKEAIDYAIIEKTNKILAIPGDFGWNDIGDWARLKDEMASDEQSVYSQADHIDIESSNMLVYSNTDRMIATIGVSNLIVVDTGDALLICDKSRSQDVKKLVDQLRDDSKHSHLL